MTNITVLCPTNDAFQRAGITLHDYVRGGAVMAGGKRVTPEEVAIYLQAHVLKGSINQLRNKTTARTLNDGEIEISTDADMRTTVRKGQNTACVLMQGFRSSNALFAGIGRVLYWGGEDLSSVRMGAPRHLSASFVAHEGHPGM